MSKSEYLRSLFSDQILPAIIRIIENAVSTLLKGLSFGVARRNGYIAYSGT